MVGLNIINFKIMESEKLKKAMELKDEIDKLRYISKKHKECQFKISIDTWNNGRGFSSENSEIKAIREFIEPLNNTIEQIVIGFIDNRIQKLHNELEAL